MKKDDYKVKYLPAFNMSKHGAVAVRVFADGYREAVDKETYPSVFETDGVYDNAIAATQAARQRWTNKGR